MNEQSVTRLKELYLEEYGIKLTDEQAQEYGSRLVTLVKAVYGSNLPKIRSKQNLTNGEQKVDN